jgi:hypothetical protein
MMNGTEDDTFRVLSRPGFDEMLRIHNEWRQRQPTKNTELRIPFMKHHNWTWLEFVLEAKKRDMGGSVW